MKVTIVTAPEHKYFPKNSLKIFLAGGICNCIKWQERVIDIFTRHHNEIEIDNSTFNQIYLLNPRRVDWIDEPGAAEKQIEWEFDMLEKCDVFTMYFAGGESDQPICMYELGRNILNIQKRFPNDWRDRIVITCDKNYKRLNDVVIQTRLATGGLVKVSVVEGDEKSVLVHADEIKKVLKYINNE